LLALVSALSTQWLAVNAGKSYGPCEEYPFCPLQVTVTECGEDLLVFIRLMEYFVCLEVLPVLNLMFGGLLAIRVA